MTTYEICAWHVAKTWYGNSEYFSYSALVICVCNIPCTPDGGTCHLFIVSLMSTTSALTYEKSVSLNVMCHYNLSEGTKEKHRGLWQACGHGHGLTLKIWHDMVTWQHISSRSGLFRYPHRQKSTWVTYDKGAPGFRQLKVGVMMTWWHVSFGQCMRHGRRF